MQRRSGTLVVLLAAVLQLCSGREAEAGPCPPGDAACREPDADGVCTVEAACVEVGARSRTFKLVVVAEQLRLKTVLPAARPVRDLWVRGSGPGLSWQRSARMNETREGEWQLPLQYSSDSEALACHSSSHCTINQRSIEFRIYRDALGQDDMKGPNFFLPLPLSGSLAGGKDFMPPKLVVQPWFDGTTITRLAPRMLKSSLGVTGIEGELHIKYGVFLPPSFDYNVLRSYPLVVMFGSYGVDYMQTFKLVEHMVVHEASIVEAVVVYVYYGTDTAPFCKNSVYGGSVWTCPKNHRRCHDCMTCWNPDRADPCDEDEFISQGERCLVEENCRDDNSGEFLLDFIELDLIPDLRRRTGNRILVDFPHDRLVMIGYEGIGLLACHAALSRPTVYGKAGCLSAPFHWPMKAFKPVGQAGYKDTLWTVGYRFQLHPELRPLHQTQMYYIDVGEQEMFYFPTVDAHLAAEAFVTDLRTVLGLELNKNIIFASVPATWTSYYHHTIARVAPQFHRLRQALGVLLRAPGGASQEHSRTPHLTEEFFAKRKTEMAAESVVKEQEGGSSAVAGVWLSAGSANAPYCGARQTEQENQVPLPIFIGTIGVCVLVSVVVTVVTQCLQGASRREAAQEKKEEEEMRREVGGSSSEDSAVPGW